MTPEQRPGERYLDYRTRLMIERRAARMEYLREAKRWQARLGRGSSPVRSSQPDDGLIFILGDDGSPRDEGPKE
jgi:hypothetical protein